MNKIFTLILLLALTITDSHLVMAGPPADKADVELVKVYPNPFVTDATIRLNKDIDLENSRVSITIYNIVGKEVLRLNNVREYDIRITRDVFLSGMYIYQLKVDDKVLTTGRFSVK